MRILIYGIDGKHRSGIDTYMKNMNRYISGNIVFDYVIEGKSCIHEEKIRALGGNIYYVTRRNENPIKNILDNYKLMRNLRGKVNVVYCNLSSLSWLASVIIARYFDYRVIVHSHSSQFVAANSSFLHRLAHYINKKWLAHMDVIRLTCSKLATKYMFEPQDHVSMIYNAININQFKFDESIRKKVRKKLGIKEKFVVGFIGRISDQKNPLFLPEIMKALQTQQTDIKMLIVGEGFMRSALEEKIHTYDLEEKCRLLGTRDDVHELLQAMDVFILPSEHEGMPYVLIEAQASGLPCVVSDAVTEEVDVTGNIAFVSLRSGAAVWADKVVKCLEHPVSNRPAAADLMLTTSFNIENEAKRLEKILRKG